MECSAKDDFNVTDLFKTLLSLSRILPAGGNESTSGLKRRSSAYVSASSKGKALSFSLFLSLVRISPVYFAISASAVGIFCIQFYLSAVGGPKYNI